MSSQARAISTHPSSLLFTACLSAPLNSNALTGRVLRIYGVLLTAKCRAVFPALSLISSSGFIDKV
jgi:hypothetical protein